MGLRSRHPDLSEPGALGALGLQHRRPVGVPWASVLQLGTCRPQPQAETSRTTWG